MGGQVPGKRYELTKDTKRWLLWISSQPLVGEPLALDVVWDSLGASPTLGCQPDHLDLMEMLWPLLAGAPGSPRGD